VLFLYTPGNAGGLFEEAFHNNRPISTMNAQEASEAFQRHRWEVIGPRPF
jgi:hypothetical protein